jgi:hypothetical protein
MLLMNNGLPEKIEETPSIKSIDFPGEIIYGLGRKWIGPGGPPGLQIQWRALNPSAVGSIPMHFRQNKLKAPDPGGLPVV